MINPRDYGRIQTGGQPGVTGGQAGIPGLLGMLQDQQTPTNKFQPKNSIADFMNVGQRPSFPGIDAPPQPHMPQIPQQHANPVQDILNQLQQLMSNGGNLGQSLQMQPMQMPTFDPNKYKNQAETSVNAQFNPIINQILAQQKQTQGRANTNKTEIGNLYQGAQQSIKADSAAAGQRYDQAQHQSNQLYTDERNRIAAGYAADAAAQRAEAKRLGTEALGTNEAIAKQTADRQFSDQMGSQQQQSDFNALGTQGQATQDYNTAIGNATKAEGITAQGDIMKQLQDYMTQSNSDLTNTRSQQAGSINDLMLKLADSGYQRDAQNTQFQYQQQRDAVGDNTNLYDRQLQMLNQQLQAAQQQQQLQAQYGSTGANGQKLNPWQDVATFAEQLRPGQGQDIVAAIQSAMNGRPEIYARASNDPVSMNPALFAKLIADYQGNQGVDRNTLMQVSQELYRQLYAK